MSFNWIILEDPPFAERQTIHVTCALSFVDKYELMPLSIKAPSLMVLSMETEFEEEKRFWSTSSQGSLYGCLLKLVCVAVAERVVSGDKWRFLNE